MAKRTVRKRGEPQIDASTLDLSDGAYFEAAQALYWYCVDWHGGQWSTLYRISCELGYKPGMSERGPGPDTSAAEWYADLEAGRLDPEDLKAAIDRAYAAAHD
jgi:hypothetical protein